MSNTGISRNGVEFLFRNARLNLDHIENIGHICEVLGKYLFVDRTILEDRAGKKIGLSYLKKAIDNDIITEMQDENTMEKKNRFYYQLGMGGKYLLDKAGKSYFDLNILADKEVKSRVLTLNYFMLDRGYDISFRCSQDILHRFFFCKDNIICYFPKVMKEMQIIRMLIRQLSTPERTMTSDDIKNRFNFIPVEAKSINIGSKTKSTLTN